MYASPENEPSSSAASPNATLPVPVGKLPSSLIVPLSTLRLPAMSTAPSMSTASRLVVPSTSMSPLISSDANTEVPVPVTVPPTPKLPAIVTFVVPVGISRTSASASFFIVTSFVDPCPVRIRPSALVKPIAALSPAEVSAVASNVPPVITPVVVIADDPVSIVPNPLVIDPESNAPTVVAAVVTRLGIAVISSSKYADKSVTATCFIVPPSFKTTRSASATVTELAEVSPSRIFISVAVDVTPSRMFSSAAVDVTLVPPISSVVTDISPATVTTPFARVIRSVSSV